MSGRLIDALRRKARALQQRVAELARPPGAALLAAAALCASPALAAPSNPARYNLDVTPSGVAGIKDLVATPAVSTGAIVITWTEPTRSGTTGPHVYELRISTLAQINSHAQFLAAPLASVFTADAPPAPGAGGGQVTVELSGLQEGVVHFFALVEKDALSATGYWSRTSGWNPSNSARAPALYVSTQAPMEPFVMDVAPAANSITFTWEPVTRFRDGELFADPQNPVSAELAGYSLFRSLTPCSTAFVLLSSVPTNTLTYTDNTGGLNYYYRLHAYNSYDKSSAPVSVSALGERSWYTDDCRSALVLDLENARMLNAATNGLGENIRIDVRRRPEDVGGPIFQSVQWKAMRNGVQEARGFTLPKPVRFVLHFDVVNGVPVPSTAPIGPMSAGPAAFEPLAQADAKNLGIYWDNGAEFKKMYGVVDEANHSVMVESPNLGVYQIRGLQRADGAVFDLSNVSNRAVTPNGDGLNDRVIFTYDPGPRNAHVTGKIYDVNGMHVADMTTGLVPNTLVWDGRSGGRAVTSGVYVYRIQGDGKTFTGTVVVAR